MNLSTITDGARKRSSIESLFVGIQMYLNGTATEDDNQKTLALAKGIQDTYLSHGDGDLVQAFTEVFNHVCKIEPKKERITRKDELFQRIKKNSSRSKEIVFHVGNIALEIGSTEGTVKRYLADFKMFGLIDYSMDGKYAHIRYIGD